MIMFCKFKYGIKTFNNILLETERINLLNESKRFLEKISDLHPGLQTKSDLHLHLDHKNLFNLISKILKKAKVNGCIERCWVNYTDENLKYISWHTHPSVKFTIVYFLDNPENIGTIFRVKKQEFQIKGPTNSLIVIPPDLEHTVPNNITKPRYSLVIDVK